jgi:hypothetical protein
MTSVDALYLLQHLYRCQPAAVDISGSSYHIVRAIASDIADKSDDILNSPRYNKGGRRLVGYVGALISKSSVKDDGNRFDQAAPGLGALARLVMDTFVGTIFIKLFMCNANEGLFPFHSDVLPASGERKIRVSISLSDMMPPFCLRRKGADVQSGVYRVSRQFMTTIAMDFESSDRLNRDWEHGTLQWADGHAVFVVSDVPCSSWSDFNFMVTNFFSALKEGELQVRRGGLLSSNKLPTCPQLTWATIGSSYEAHREVSDLDPFISTV